MRLHSYKFRNEVSALVAKIIEASQQDEHISALYLFGSHARNEATILSDVDFAVVSQIPAKVNRGCLNYAAESFDIPCDFVYTTDKAIAASTSELDVNFQIKTKGVLLWQR